MKVRTLGLLMGLILGMLASTSVTPTAQAGSSIGCWSRSQASSYAYTGRYEGYEWGGGWWNDNNFDDTPGCATDGGPGCEGPDCSGFVFKSWSLPNSYGSSTYFSWGIGENVHGPYNSTAYRDGCGGACFDVCGGGTAACGSASYGSTEPMDAYANSGHIGMIYSEGSNGYDNIIEALNNSAGTGIWQRSYRNDGSYDGVRRGRWC